MVVGVSVYSCEIGSGDGEWLGLCRCFESARVYAIARVQKVSLQLKVSWTEQMVVLRIE